MTYNIITPRAPQVVIEQAALAQLQQDLNRRIADLERLRMSIETLAAVNEPTRFTAAAMALCNQLAAKWKATRASVGLLKGRYVKLAAMSHTEKFTRQMQLVQDIEGAMEECLDQDVEVLFPSSPTATYVARTTETLATRHGPSAVLALPLRRGGEVVAVVLLERKADAPFAGDEIEMLRLTCDMATPRILDLYHTDKWAGAKALAASRRGLAVLVGPKHTWAKGIAVAVCAFLVFAIFVHGTHRVDASFTLEATDQASLHAPWDGYIKSVRVNVGDWVLSEKTEAQLKELGDLCGPMGNPFDFKCFSSELATLDVSTLKTKLASELAEEASYLKQRDIARNTDGKTADAQVYQAKADEARARANGTQYEIDQAVIRSPIDGVVFSGDWYHKIGVLVSPKDAAMFEVGQPATLRAELSVPSDQILYLKLGQNGTLATTAYPGIHMPFHVDRINPAAEVAEHHGTYKIRVTLDKPADAWMRPGMEGQAKVDIDKRTYAWLWTNRLVNWVRMKLWM